MSLRSRLAILIALAIIAAVVSQSILGFLEFQRVIYKDLDGDLDQFLGLVAGRINSFDDLKSLDTSYENYVTRARIIYGSKVVAVLGGQFPNAKCGQSGRNGSHGDSGGQTSPGRISPVGLASERDRG